MSALLHAPAVETLVPDTCRGGCICTHLYPPPHPVLTVTVAHRADDEFYELGTVAHAAEPAALFASLVALDAASSSLDQDASMRVMVDYWHGGTLSDDQVISADTAAVLLGLDRDGFDLRLEQARADLRAYRALS
ncbi:hypothetical protein [Nocardioides sp. Leaf285]|uniref:hypothetical protein n=1 Tax=Nocardioides sp. Leaf285 TaxID=1736322 RepID=UPI000702E61C|nr:hypothetical protein [Nocardioides sp. Leaf285]KQP63018.1 hypothetical protein ASF47_18575 [Nocardioides sp. Leaf285]